MIKLHSLKNLPLNREKFKYFIGVDPGKTGATAVLSKSNKLLILLPHKDLTAYEYREALLAYKENAYVMIESVNAAPKEVQGVVSAFTFGTEFGKVCWAFPCMGFDPKHVVRVAPSRWQGNLVCLTKGKKLVSKIRAQKLYPAHKKRITLDTADGVLIAHYCRKMLLE